MRNVLFIVLLLKATIFFAQHGSLDPAFGEQGNALYHFGDYETISPVYVSQGNSGRIVTSGIEQGCVLLNHIGYVRVYNENGDVDTSFGNNGQVFVDSNLEGPMEDVYVLDDDSILFSTWAGAKLTKLEPDGAIDSSFGNNGILLMDTQSYGGTGHKLHPDGSVFLTGITYQNPNQILIKKYTSDGIPDTGFGNQGTASIEIDPNLLINVRSLLIKHNSTILITYATRPSFNDPYTAYLSKLSPNGTLDTTFGDNGKLILNIENPDKATFHLHVNDHILISYSYYDNQQMAYIRKIIRMTQNGEIDLNFADNGVLIDHSIELIEQNQRIITNSTIPDPQGGMFPQLFRYFPNGALDSSFNFEYTYFNLSSIRTTPSIDGDFLLAGADFCDNQQESHLLISKYKSTPLGINEAGITKLVVYPNPASDVIYLENHESLKVSSIILYDVLGRLVMVLDDVEDEIDVSHLESGLFFVRIEAENGSTVKKLIKE